MNFQKRIHGAGKRSETKQDWELVEKGQRANQHSAVVVLRPLHMSCLWSLQG